MKKSQEYGILIVGGVKVYKLCFWLMIIGYLGLTLQGIDLRAKAIGFVLLIANFLIFWR